MKTNTTRWIASLLTIVIVTAATNSTFAQRRSNQNDQTETRIEQKREIRKNTTREKSMVKTRNPERKSKPEVRQNAPVPRNETKAAKVNERNTTARRSTSVRIDTKSRQVNRPSTEKNTTNEPRFNNERRDNIYRIDHKDSRYTPNKNFKGNNQNWKANYTKHHVPYSTRNINFYNHYDHRKYKHWDRSWEKYHWSLTSWRDYYNGYHPQSYKFHKHYYFHPGFGHVIRKFQYRPVRFVYNNATYYNYNGHFFRHFRSVGYVLVDMPHGIVFRNLPSGYDRVYVNGYPYFRIGNLFFEMHPHGYSLVHYPERYFAPEIGFHNNGHYQTH